MNDLLLRGAVGITTAGNRAADAVKGRYSDARENGDIVQTIIIIAMFVLICVIVGGILMTAIQGQADKVGDCISNANSGACNDFE